MLLQAREGRDIAGGTELARKKNSLSIGQTVQIGHAGFLLERRMGCSVRFAMFGVQRSYAWLCLYRWGQSRCRPQGRQAPPSALRRRTLKPPPFFLFLLFLFSFISLPTSTHNHNH